jgi:hypothetical protein
MFFFLSFFFYKIGKQQGGTGPAQFRSRGRADTTGRGWWRGKDVRG